VPIDEWIPKQYREDANLVVGWEFYAGYDQNVIREFEIWTMMARPGLSHLWVDILQSLRDVTAARNVTVSQLTVDMVGDVVDFTGPRRMTRSVIKSLEDTVMHTRIDYEPISQITKPVLLGDVLIMPGYTFAESLNHYKGKVGPVLVTNHFAGTWKNGYGGEVV
jgi:hypothetical protein